MIIGLCGKSGVGKSTICDEIVKLGYKKVVTDTTRPPREGEVNEVDYFFDTDAEFDELLDLGEFIETTSYHVATGETWRYGTTRGQLAEAEPKGVIILNPDGVKMIRELNISTKIFWVFTNKNTVLSRLKNRGDSPDEIERRMKADDEDFADIESYVDYKVFNNEGDDVSEIARCIIEVAETGSYE